MNMLYFLLKVAAQLKPVWEALRKRNEPYKLKMLSCQVGFWESPCPLFFISGMKLLTSTE